MSDPATDPENGHCPLCCGAGTIPVDDTGHDTIGQPCPICDGDGRLWCCLCGTWGNHRSGAPAEFHAMA